MTSGTLTKEEVLQGFHSAMRNGELILHYQPQYNYETNRIIGAEALMRWNHKEKGLQMPGVFIHVLEGKNMIYYNDIYAFELVCKFISQYREKVPLVPISFNISRRDIYEHNLVEDIEKIRNKYGVSTSLVRIEITETVTMGGPEQIINLMEELHKLGYIVEMDDFGSGYSSLGLLKDLPVDVIKLDMNFVDKGIQGRGAIIVSSVLKMAKWLNTPVIAEGVETEEQARFMHEHGCYYIQGYYYSKPVPETTFVELLRKEPTGH